MAGRGAIENIIEQSKDLGLIFALAGGLRGEDVEKAAKYGIDIIGVRSAACSGDRVTGRVEAEKVRSLKQVLELITDQCTPGGSGVQ